MTLRRADSLELPEALRRLYYAGANLEHLLKTNGESEMPLGLILTTSDPMDTVVGHYLGLAQPDDLTRQTTSMAGPEFELAGIGYRVQIHAYSRTTIVVLLGERGDLAPPEVPSPPQPGDSATVWDTREAYITGNLSTRDCTTKPLDPSPAA